ncbi:hypothetical protein BH23BAC1_BH23BAC1_44340 [soil metagenome]
MEKKKIIPLFTTKIYTGEQFNNYTFNIKKTYYAAFPTINGIRSFIRISLGKFIYFSSS